MTTLPRPVASNRDQNRLRRLLLAQARLELALAQLDHAKSEMLAARRDLDRTISEAHRP